ncbi:hypothetical protein LTR15_002797 [Elasticomyces elasticus]|nr:hypothetical protein LTR15_002797 [Elasticomyces elasticus]
MSPSCGAMRLLIIQIIFCSIPALSTLIAVDLKPIGPSPEHLERGGEVEDLFRPTTNTSIHYVDSRSSILLESDEQKLMVLDQRPIKMRLNGSRVIFKDVNTDVEFKTDLWLQFNDIEDYKAAKTAWAPFISNLIFLVSDEFAFEGLGDQSVYR